MQRSSYFAGIALLLSGCFAPIASAQIYKCTVDGKPVFSDTACGSDAVAIEQPRVNVLGGPATQNDASQEDQPAPDTAKADPVAEVESDCISLSSQELRKKIIQKTVFVGMRDSDVIKSWGKPSRINRSSRTDQWVYDRGAGAQYVYIGDEGCVTAWN